MVMLWSEINEKSMFIFKFHLEDGVWIYINNIYSESLINMLQESVLHEIGSNPVLGQCNKNQIIRNSWSSLDTDHFLSD